MCALGVTSRLAAANLASISTVTAIVIVNKKILNFFDNLFIGNLLVPLHLLCTVAISRGRSCSNNMPLRWKLLISFASVASLFSSNLVLKYASVGFQQTGRLLAVPLSSAVDRFYWGDSSLTRVQVVCVFGIVIGVLLVCVDSVTTESMVPVIANLVAVCGQVGSQNLLRVSASKFHCSAAEHVQQLSPYSAAVSIVCLIVAFASSSTRAGAFDSLPGALPPHMIVYITASCALGVAIQFLSTWLSQVSSSLSYSLLTLTKSVCTIGFGSLIFSEIISLNMSCGMILSLLMFFLYLYQDAPRYPQR